MISNITRTRRLTLEPKAILRHRVLAFFYDYKFFHQRKTREKNLKDREQKGQISSGSKSQG